jgi:hypothetical protein
LRDEPLGDISVARTSARGAAAMREMMSPVAIEAVQRSLQSMGADYDVGGREVARHRTSCNWTFQPTWRPAMASQNESFLEKPLPSPYPLRTLARPLRREVRCKRSRRLISRALSLIRRKTNHGR